MVQPPITYHHSPISAPPDSLPEDHGDHPAHRMAGDLRELAGEHTEGSKKSGGIVSLEGKKIGGGGEVQPPKHVIVISHGG